MHPFTCKLGCNVDFLSMIYRGHHVKLSPFSVSSYSPSHMLCTTHSMFIFKLMENGNRWKIEDNPVDSAAEGHQNLPGLGVFRAPCPSLGWEGGILLILQTKPSPCTADGWQKSALPPCKLINMSWINEFCQCIFAAHCSSGKKKKKKKTELQKGMFQVIYTDTLC